MLIQHGASSYDFAQFGIERLSLFIKNGEEYGYINPLESTVDKNIAIAVIEAA